MHLTEAISLFLDACIAEGKSDATYKIYRSCLNSLLRFTGDCLLSDMDERLLRSYLKSLRLKQEKHDSNPYRPTVDRPLSGETIRTYYRHIRVFLSWCYDEGLMEHNPTLRVKMPPAPRRGPKGLTDEDFWAMVEAAGQGSTTAARDRALVLTLGDTGARARGIVGLTLDQLDLDSALIEVVEKGNKSRIIPISEITIQALEEWLAVRPDPPDVPYVFTSHWGGKLSTSGLYQALERIAERAGVEGRFNPHAFRHFFGRKWMESGGDIAPLSDMLGHSQIHVTKQYYLRYDVETIQREHHLHSPVAGWVD